MKRSAIYIRLILLTATLLPVLQALGQMPFTSVPYKTEIRKGNQLFVADSFSSAPDAEVHYKKALEEKNNAPEAVFNLGDAEYQQGRYDTAANHFKLAATIVPDSLGKAKALHNLGNAYAQAKKYEEAVKAYKDALKLNPHDADTKYNLAWCNEKLRNKNQGGGGGQNNQQQKKDDKQQQDKNQQNKQQNQQQQKQQQQQGNQQKQQPKLSKQEAEQLMQALQNEEQKANQKVQQKQVKVLNMKTQKDW